MTALVSLAVLAIVCTYIVAIEAIDALADRARRREAISQETLDRLINGDRS